MEASSGEVRLVRPYIASLLGQNVQRAWENLVTDKRIARPLLSSPLVSLACGETMCEPGARVPE